MSTLVPLTPLNQLRLIGSELIIFSLIDAEYVIFSFETQNQNLGYFIESYDVYSTGLLTRLQNSGDLEDKTFLISFYNNKNSDGTIVEAYAGIGDNVRINELQTYPLGLFPVTKYTYSHSVIERQRLDDLYSDDNNVSLQIDLTQRDVAQTSPQNMVQTSRISYDSVSSLGSISSESFVISSTSATDTEDIEFGTEVITDVGGVVSRDRELYNTGVSGEITFAVYEDEVESGTDPFDAFDASISRTSTVTTSGY